MSNVRQHEMPTDPATIDFRYAKNALFVRQTLAKFAGLPIDREITWESLRDHICDPDKSVLPNRVVLRGLSSLSLAAPDEARMLRHLLKEVAVARPDIQVQIAILE